MQLRQRGLQHVQGVVDRPLHPQPLAVTYTAIRATTRMLDVSDGTPVSALRRDSLLLLPQVPIHVEDPIVQDVRACDPSVLPREHLRRRSMLVCAIGMCTMHQQREHDWGMPVRAREMQGRRSGGTNDRCISAFVAGEFPR